MPLAGTMAGQVLPSAEGNIRAKMADLHLDLAQVHQLPPLPHIALCWGDMLD